MDKHSAERIDNEEDSASGDLTGAFFLWMDKWAQEIAPLRCAPLVVAVSGGADSMALAHLLWSWAGRNDYAALVLTVDHGLRPEAAAEARAVAAYIKTLAGADAKISHKILEWRHDEKPSSRLQENAREARYALMAQDMRACGGKFLFTAHHQGDQAETFLFRLAKGSGLDGLAGMAEQQVFDGDLVLCRPLLGVPKSALVAYCAAQEIPFVHDPSNDQERFARVRLRNSMDVLEREGLSEKRLAQTAARMARARKALENLAALACEQVLVKKETDCAVFNFNALRKMPDEIILRIIVMMIKDLGEAGKYGVRSERVEAVLEDLLKPFPFRKRTLGKMVFERDDKSGYFIMTVEEGKS